MESSFQIVDVVTWTSQSSGYTRTKRSLNVWRPDT
ncbi:hypothetical protein BCO19218_06285 [Burkholderia contaminans]|nr:hypothetical protein BCO19218_06285 [Burkholderia contaminans]